MKKAAIHLIRFYQTCLSGIFPASCRYHPSCSEYAVNAIEKKGLLRGSLKAARRLLRCNPFFPGGYDPVD